MNLIITLFISLSIIVLDQLSKWKMMEIVRDGPIEVSSFFNLVVVWNYGVSFGLFSNDSDYGRYLLIALSLAICIGFLVWMFRTQSRVNHIGIALVLGGAIGNVIDRFRFGAVFDFLDFHVAGYHWPAFNVADSAICVGVFILMIYAFLFEKTLHPEAKI